MEELEVRYNHTNDSIFMNLYYTHSHTHTHTYFTIISLLIFIQI